MAKIMYYTFYRTETVFQALYWGGVAEGVKSSYKSPSANMSKIF